jgi:hypothetical protein
VAAQKGAQTFDNDGARAFDLAAPARVAALHAQDAAVGPDARLPRQGWPDGHLPRERYLGRCERLPLQQRAERGRHALARLHEPA